MDTYARFPLALVRGKGVWVWDQSGRRYLDAVAGIAVCTLGHSNPTMRRALCRQLGTLQHVSNLYRIPEQEALAEALVRRSCADRVFFCNSGAEANEAAIKLARKHGHLVRRPASTVAPWPPSPPLVSRAITRASSPWWKGSVTFPTTTSRPLKRF
jgi:acetylornithine/N-succinyldiaminopimelate aminotransferase